MPTDTSYTPPETGEKAPDFALPSDDRGDITLSDLAGSAVVLFFYPKDNTPGCTKEACGFSDDKAAFEAAGARVFGISKDSLKKHENFRKKHGLTVPLLSDADSETCEKYGVWKEKKMYGKTFWGIERTTVLIASDGTIARIWRKVKVPGHVEEVLATVKELSA
ncbi:thioredoxin-dependent thiol peroxidase [Halocynthiibacter styelae]|uniref:thioredoxin-dependent peroxiredoxin n=1 Tax=Halocynthiibacter styelae TaxID=2761955 RepID=A0A8J7LKK1_9RHOB|nr:thioredoxin-dependent thiol peroxidase [Paenihalocynthiibacter styelae]MBI1494165.1 thioredoxin-dependent thiol peroxidase [Paenihalocynthiibacter styelae]